MASSQTTYITNAPLDEDAAKQNRHYLSIFRRVMALYYEHKAAPDKGDGAGANDGIVTMSPSDFICDVETSALRGLTAPEYSFFEGVFKLRNEKFIALLTQQMGETRYNKVKQRVQLKLGATFKERGIFPTSEYFKPVDTR